MFDGIDHKNSRIDIGREFLLFESLYSNLMVNDFRGRVPKIKLNGLLLQLTKIYVYFLWLANIAQTL